jgi:hypothetical protein
VIISHHPWTKHRRTCVAALRNHTHWGDKHRLRDGMNLDTCGRHAAFLVEGEPMCSNHAQQVALRWVMHRPEGETMTAGELRVALGAQDDAMPVRLVVRGVAHGAPMAWVEPRQEGGQRPAFCIGDDPR